MFQARVNGLDEVFRMPIEKNATIYSACKLIQSEFNLDKQLKAEISGSELHKDSLLHDFVTPSDVITFSPIDGTHFSGQSLKWQRLGPICLGEFRLFSSLSIKSLTEGDHIPIADDMNDIAVKRAVVDFLEARYAGALPANPQFQVFLPGGAVYEKGTIADFRQSFPHFRPHLYVVVTRSIKENILSTPVAQVVKMDADTKPLLSPIADASELGYSLIACFLGYIANNGTLSEEIIYSLSKVVPFAPMVNSLTLLVRREHLLGSSITQITAPLYTILLEVFKTQNNTTTTFEHLLELLRFIGQKTYVGRVQCTLFKQPFLKHGFELFFNGFQTVTIPMLDIDFRELDFIQLQLEINNQAIIAATSKVLMFIPVTVMSARRQNRICFLSLKNHMGLFLSSTAAKQQTRDKLCIIDPAKGKQEDWDPETLAKEIGVQDLEKFAAVEEVSELVIVCVDTSGSMKSPFANTSRFEAAQIFFRKFADQAYKFRVDNVYGLSQFGRQFGTIRELSPISADFKDGLNNLAVAGNTPMWDVICEAANKLAIKQREAYAGRPLRIIVLTDGGSNGRKTITDALPLLLRYNIHLDGIIFGSDAPDRRTELDWFGPLIAAVRMTGGYMFIPKTMDDTDRLFQDEAFFNATIREYGPMLPQEELAQLRTRIAQDSAEAKADTKMRSKNHEKTIGTSSRNFADAWWIIANKGRPESYRDARLLEELRYVAGNANPDIHVLVNRDDISEWRVLFRVDENSRYSNLWFQLLLKFPDLYPANGPFIRFVGPPYHVNVSEQGRINLPEVQEYYDESFHVFEIVEEIKLLLQKVRRRARLYRGDDDVVEPADCGDGIDPLTDDNPIDNAHAQAYHDPARYKALVAEWNARNGKRDPSEFITDWNVLRHPEDKRDEIEAKEAWPRQYICPITGKAIQEPVRSPTTGYYYEQAALQRLLEATPGVTCPMTGKPFTAADDQLPVDPVMKQRIADFKERNN